MGPTQTDISEIIAKYWVISFGRALLLYGSEPSAQIAIGSRAQPKERADPKSQLRSGCDFLSACHPLQIGRLMSRVSSYCPAKTKQGLYYLQQNCTVCENMSPCDEAHKNINQIWYSLGLLLFQFVPFFPDVALGSWLSEEIKLLWGF